MEVSAEATKDWSKNNSEPDDNQNNSALPETPPLDFTPAPPPPPLRSSISKPSAMRGAMSTGKTQRSVSMAENVLLSRVEGKDHIETVEEEGEITLTPESKTATDKEGYDTNVGVDSMKPAADPEHDNIAHRKKSILKKAVQLTRADLPSKRVTLADEVSFHYEPEKKLSPFWVNVNIYRSNVSEAVEHPAFQLFIASAILANVIVMATEHADMSELHETVLYKANAVSYSILDLYLSSTNIVFSFAKEYGVF